MSNTYTQNFSFIAEIHNDEDQSVKHFITMARSQREAILWFRKEHEPSGDGNLPSDYEPSMFTENNVRKVKNG